MSRVFLLSTLFCLPGLAPAAPAAAQAARDATLIVTVIDQGGGVIPAATVTVTRLDDDAKGMTSIVTSGAGVATIKGLAPGRYAVQAQFTGFDVGRRDVSLRRGVNRCTVTLPLARVEDSVTVLEEAQAAAADPRGRAFRTVLTREEIDALSDDPADMLQQLLDLAGGTAQVSVDGFVGAAIPPKALIKSIHIERDRFAAEHHSPDFDEVAIVTKPGSGPLRGGGSSRLRDGSMSGRSPFTRAKGPERTQAYQGNLGGALVRDKASFALSGGSVRSFDTPNLHVALPGGGTRAESLGLRRPADTWTTYDLLDVALTPAHALRAAYVWNRGTMKNLGVGAYDLTERAYAARTEDQEVRLQESGPLGRRLFAQTRMKMHWSAASSRAAVEAPTIRVLDAQTSGGAQLSGGRRAREFELATDVDYVHGMHALRTGLQLEGGRFRSDASSNYLGTYTFTSLAALAAGQPATYTRRIGDPLVQYGNLTAGAYVQDDVRVRKGVTISAGVRVEGQTHVQGSWNPGPRVAVTWAPFKSGRTAFHVSYGLFYEWIRTSIYEQTLLIDGVRQQEVNLVDPPYPVAGIPGVLDAGNRYVLGPDVRLGKTTKFSADFDQTIVPRVRLNLSYSRGRDARVPRGENLNAPIDGLRPDPAWANVIAVVSDGAFRSRQFQANLTMNLSQPARGRRAPAIDWRRGTVRLSYTMSKQESNSDGAFSVSPTGTLATEWGPAFFNRRHRVAASVSSQAIRNLSATLSLAANTGTPYTVTTGLDANGDSIFNDRPAGVGRNSVRMPGQYTLTANLSYSIALGAPRASADGARGDNDPRYRLTWTINAVNLTNHANYTGFSGVETSPFFRQATAVQNPRKVDIGMTFGF
jgi:hypothetical protein